MNMLLFGKRKRSRTSQRGRQSPAIGRAATMVAARSTAPTAQSQSSPHPFVCVAARLLAEAWELGKDTLSCDALLFACAATCKLSQRRLAAAGCTWQHTRTSRWVLAGWCQLARLLSGWCLCRKKLTVGRVKYTPKGTLKGSTRFLEQLFLCL